MRTILTCMVATTAVLSGCSESSTTADCSVWVRYQGTIYSETGFTEKVGTEVGTGVLAVCTDSERQTFPDDAEQVAVWTIPGRASSEAIAIKHSGDNYRVLEVEAEG